VKYFYTYKQYEQKTPTDIILCKSNIRSYVTHLQTMKKHAGTTIADKLSHLRHALDFLTEDTTTTRNYLRAQEALKYVNRNISSVSKTKQLLKINDLLMQQCLMQKYVHSYMYK